MNVVSNESVSNECGLKWKSHVNVVSNVMASIVCTPLAVFVHKSCYLALCYYSAWNVRRPKLPLRLWLINAYSLPCSTNSLFTACSPPTTYIKGSQPVVHDRSSRWYANNFHFFTKAWIHIFLVYLSSFVSICVKHNTMVHTFCLRCPFLICHLHEIAIAIEINFLRPK